MKLQKLVYYSQAWQLAWEEQQLFDEPIEAWAGGPVCPQLYTRHKGKFNIVSDIFEQDDVDSLTAEEKHTVDLIISFYGAHTAQWLSDLTHLEAPWKQARARANAPPGAICHEEITFADMGEYYSGLMANAAAEKDA